ncbi:hypothetical protein TVAG_198360 [Trichomonas vaginalis G3]|uniref:Uncharacterized protein n=1 Tax=Trichomonas vaginalis (strain ATCC PRA-98 / G3) TaxID=412133 RepID=A2DDM2_TRIV3|nr:hypothetical protein TVAGG3_0998780 [Trichomonas vaginalis G3]EAY21398.1 hypothetical protein TVAG_198360 [Trichomonas vaginalis G3]KAI5490611.1 hypothetical protein TVAGG3_0998780 [Trichomonas vaginalis G3]|eukprot:XP_001582384.1 hypothetical protein [Trichomonas vaginalis G3]
MISNPEIPGGSIERDLDRTMSEVARIHATVPAQYYFNEGKQDGILLCRAVITFLKLSSKTYIESFFQNDKAIPIHPLFSKIKNHIQQISRFYQNKIDELLNLFLTKLIPSNPLPLRNVVLSQMSLFTTKVFLHPKLMQPDPIQAYVDGYFNLVIDLIDNIIRIPLIPKQFKEGQSLQSATLPPSLRFKGLNEADEQSIKQFILEEAPKRGRRIQYHAFLSVLNHSKEPSDYQQSLRFALSSIDLSFSTAICVLSTSPDDFEIISSLLNILTNDHRIDFFIRALSVSCLSDIQKDNTSNCMELIALSNIFISQSYNWTSTIKPDGGISSIVKTVCNMIIENKISDIAVYILKIALVIAAYSDKTGSDVICMLLEITIRPFAIAFSMQKQLDELKSKVVSKDPSFLSIRATIEKYIVDFLSDDISIRLMPHNIYFGIRDIHDFIEEKLDDFIKIVIYLNSKEKEEHPTMKMFKFSYDMCVKYNMI